jgi:hypothetical protein
MCEILGTLYSQYKDDESFKDFLDFNDLGLPLAYFSAENLCEVSDDGVRYITETWNLFLQSLELEDIGFETLDQMLSMSQDDTPD